MGTAGEAHMRALYLSEENVLGIHLLVEQLWDAVRRH